MYICICIRVYMQMIDRVIDFLLYLRKVPISERTSIGRRLAKDKDINYLFSPSPTVLSKVCCECVCERESVCVCARESVRV